MPSPSKSKTPASSPKGQGGQLPPTPQAPLRQHYQLASAGLGTLGAKAK